MARTLATARTVIGSARTNATARTGVSIYRTDEIFTNSGVTALWDFRNGFTGENGNNIPSVIGGDYLSATAITVGTFYTLGEYSGNFDASNDRCISNLGARSFLPSASTITNFTAFAWIKRTNLNVLHNFILNWQGGGNQRGWMLQANSGNKLLFSCSPDGTTVASQLSNVAILNNTNWNFVCATYVGSTQTVALYNNGGSIASATNSGTIPTSIFIGNAAFSIGAFANGTTVMDGKIGICGVAPSTAMSATQITNLYNYTRQFYGV